MSGVIKIKILREGAKLPTKAYTGDYGWDLYAAEDVNLTPGNPGLIPTGIAMELPPGTGGLIAGRSGLAKKGLIIGGGVIDEKYRGEIIVIATALQPSPCPVCGGAGVVASSGVEVTLISDGVISLKIGKSAIQESKDQYSLQIQKCQYCHGAGIDTVFRIKKGQKVAQLLIHSNVTRDYKIVKVENLSSTERGTRGFGSSGE